MRYMLKESSEEKAMLNSELEYIQDFIELSKLSFEDPKFLEFTSGGDFSGKQIPPLLFIPIIEIYRKEKFVEFVDDQKFLTNIVSLKRKRKMLN